MLPRGSRQRRSKQPVEIAICVTEFSIVLELAASETQIPTAMKDLLTALLPESQVKTIQRIQRGRRMSCWE